MDLLSYPISIPPILDHMIHTASYISRSQEPLREEEGSKLRYLSINSRLRWKPEKQKNSKDDLVEPFQEMIYYYYP